MKKLVFNLSLLVVATLTLWGCFQKETPSDSKKSSSGKTLEVLVAADREVFNGTTKDIIDSILKAPQDGLPQPEACFDVANVPVSSFRNTEMFRVHRNVILCDISTENPNKVYLHVDSYAEPQVVFDFAVRDHQSLDSLLRVYAPRMTEEFYKAEHRRIIKAFYGMKNPKLMNQIHDKFGFTLTFSDEFAIAKDAPDFLWVRKEAKDFGIGVLIEAFPYTDKKMFDESQILDRLDTAMRHHVPGPAEGSYMGTERRLDFYTNKAEMKGIPYCVETRGCYRTFGDYYGGPFVCYTLLSPDQNRVIQLTGYVYYPSGRIKNLSKRDLLMQVESICHSITFDK